MLSVSVRGYEAGKVILIDRTLSEAELVAEALTAKADRKVVIKVPQRGEHRRSAEAGAEQQGYQDHGPMQPMNVHSINVLAVVCSDIDGVPGGRSAVSTVGGLVRMISCPMPTGSSSALAE